MSAAFLTSHGFHADLTVLTLSFLAGVQQVVVFGERDLQAHPGVTSPLGGFTGPSVTARSWLWFLIVKDTVKVTPYTRKVRRDWGASFFI